jgi:putative ABC transport system permease protein
MLSIALKMLLGDTAKYLGLVFGIAFATLLMSQQVSIFIGLMTRTANQVLDISEADLWVMDSRVRYVDEVEPLPDQQLFRVRGVQGVEWATPLFKGNAILRTQSGLINQINILGVDDASLVGAPRKWIEGDPSALRKPLSIVFDKQGYDLIWPGEPIQLGRTAEINDTRIVVGGVADPSASFITFPLAYMKYSDAIRITPPQRNKLSFVLVRVKPGEDKARVAQAIREATGLQVRSRIEFAWQSVNYYLTRTGIPVNFGITIALGVIIGVAITAQTFSIFVLENIKQFGALKAMGTTNLQIFGMIMGQAAFVLVVGFGLGIGACAAFFKFVPAGAAALEGFVLRWEVVAGTAVLMTVIMLVSVVASVQRVMRVDPAIVFRG